MVICFKGGTRPYWWKKDAYCKELSRYIHLNPVKAGLVERPSAYPWSSYSAYIGKTERPEWLTVESVLGFFDAEDKKAQRLYRNFVVNAIGKEQANPMKEVFASTFLGGETFILRAKEEWVGLETLDSRNVPVLKQLAEVPSLEAIEGCVEIALDREHRDFKKICLYAGQQFGGYSLKELGRHFKMRGSAVSQSNRRLKRKITAEVDLEKTIEKIRRSVRNVEC